MEHGERVNLSLSLDFFVPLRNKKKLSDKLIWAKRRQKSTENKRTSERKQKHKETMGRYGIHNFFLLSTTRCLKKEIAWKWNRVREFNQRNNYQWHMNIHRTFEHPL